MGKLTKKQLNLNNKSGEQLKIINNYFFPKRFNAFKMSDRHYCDLVLEKKQNFNVREKAVTKLAISDNEFVATTPLESLSFCYDGDYLYKNGNSSKAKYLCLFLGARQIYSYSYTFDMSSNNFNECATEIFYNSIVAISTEEKVCENEVDLYGFLNERGKRSIHTVVTLKIYTSGGEFEFTVQKTPEVEGQIEKIRQYIREFRTIKVKKPVQETI